MNRLLKIRRRVTAFRNQTARDMYKTTREQDAGVAILNVVLQIIDEELQEERRDLLHLVELSKPA